MKTVTNEFQVFTFAELSEQSKEKAKQDFLSSECRNWKFQDYCKDEVEYLFPNSGLEFAYSIGCCQGGGWTIYGKLDFSDIMEKFSEKYTDKEKRTLKWVFDEFMYYGMEFELSRYNYSFNEWDYNSLIDEMEFNCMRNIPYKLIERFAEDVNDWMGKFCSDMERYGYEYLYNISDEEMEETSDANGWEFLEDGTMF